MSTIRPMTGLRFPSLVAFPAIVAFHPILAFVAILALSDGSRGAEATNVVLMMADDQGWGETGYNGHPHVQTPVLDEMSRTALRLDRFYSGAPNCTPTRATVMTGRHANRSGAFAPNWSTRPEEITVAQILKQAGYRTGHFGKWHLGAVKKASPLSRNGAPPEIMKGESSEIIVKKSCSIREKSPC